MRVYLDDDSVSGLLIRLLRQAGHDVLIPADVNKTGDNDSVHFTVAIQTDRVILTQNHDDFEDLHDLVIASGGHHSGVLVVRRDNNPNKDMVPKSVVRALANLISAGVPLSDEIIVLNHWR
jgi:predicted nuclease of predicted toxin-antitoxin system